MNYEDLLEQLYQAPVSGEWDGVAVKLGEFVDRRHVVLARRSRQTGLVLRAHYGFDYADYESMKERFNDDADAYIESLSAKPNRRANHGLAPPPQTRGYFDLDAHMRQNFGITAEFGAILQLDRFGKQFVSIFRDIDDSKPDRIALTKFTMILPHLRRAIELAAAYEQRTAYALSLEATFEALSAAVFLCAADGRVMEMNTTAQQIAKQANGIRLASGHLHFTDKKADSAFHKGIGGAGASPPSARVRLAARRSGGLLPLWVTIIGNANGNAVVFVEDPERDFLPECQILEKVAALSPAQSRAARLAAAGFDTMGIARELGVSSHTALTHLRRAMLKLDCSDRLALATRLAALKGITG